MNDLGESDIQKLKNDETLFKKFSDILKQLSEDDTVTISKQDLKEAVIELREETMTKAYYDGVQSERKRYAKESLLTVGFHKGEMDFGVRTDLVNKLTQKQMDDFRSMIIVGAGVAEEERRRSGIQPGEVKNKL